MGFLENYELFTVKNEAFMLLNLKTSEVKKLLLELIQRLFRTSRTPIISFQGLSDVINAVGVYRRHSQTV